MPKRAEVQPLVVEWSAFQWSAFDPQAAFRCLPAIAILLASGLALGQPAGGMIAASGAMSVGFGSFQRIGKSQLTPMLFGCAGMCLSTLAGTLAGQSAIALGLTAGFWGFLYGILIAFSAGASWAGLQSTIALLVVSAYPVTMGRATARASLILAGGLLQILVVSLLRTRIEEEAASPDLLAGGWRIAFKHLRRTLTLDSEALHYSLRMGLTLAVTAGVARAISIHNGYWFPMTALIVLRPDFRQTLVRGVARVAGTLVGGLVATLLAAILRPGPVALACVVVVFAWLCYTLLRVNYATYAACITVYIVFLLGFAGLPEMSTVKYRALNTFLGGVVALVSYLVRRPSTSPYFRA